MKDFSFYDRDLSWLSFNERVLLEAGKASVPLLERINFLSIYSSNLDEFYRVRIPALMALQNIQSFGSKEKTASLLQQAVTKIDGQLQLFGKILFGEIIDELASNNIYFVYNKPIPESIGSVAEEYFLTQVLAFIQPVYIANQEAGFFPGNNKLYKAVVLEQPDAGEETVIVNIPSDSLARFYSTTINNTQYVVFIDDIIKENLQHIFPGTVIKGSYNFKTTRDAELDLQDEFEGDIAEKIEHQIAKRDLGFATRFLYQPDMPAHLLQQLIGHFNLQRASVVAGGMYHNLKDLSSFPVKATSLSYSKWVPAKKAIGNSLLNDIANKDILLHPPYQSYDTVLRFFNEAAIDAHVEEIYLTMYRIAQDSKIASALISASKNGKKVTVFIELKARFDEANNLKWSKRMKEAGIKIIYSIPALKVHAKVALVKKKQHNRSVYYGLFATGNLNESTARFYTDHILLTANHAMLRELELLFIFLTKRRKPKQPDEIPFQELLVAQFNLQETFLQLIDEEINNAKNGLEASITIKLNNLEEKKLISKLYEASNAGVNINLIVRSICCLVPNEAGQSTNINIKRIVDRYLEHGRVFIFHNKGYNKIYLGSSDWMNRNIYRRIEVCFPIHDEALKHEIRHIIQLQLNDNISAVQLDSNINNIPIVPVGEEVQSQKNIYELLSTP